MLQRFIVVRRSKQSTARRLKASYPGLAAAIRRAALGAAQTGCSHAVVDKQSDYPIVEAFSTVDALGGPGAAIYIPTEILRHWQSLNTKPKETAR